IGVEISPPQTSSNQGWCEPSQVCREERATLQMPDENDDRWNEAMALLLRWQAAPGDARARDHIVRFCAESEEHLAAWESAKRLYRLTGEATGAPAREQARRRTRQLTRRGVIGGLGALAAGTAALKGPELWRRWQADMVSDAGV